MILTSCMFSSYLYGIEMEQTDYSTSNPKQCSNRTFMELK